MSEWSSLQDILNDLSVAQGCVVPASLDAIRSKEPPKSLRECDDLMTEYQHEVSCTPDLEMIQEMLSAVNQDDAIENDDVTEIEHNAAGDSQPYNSVAILKNPKNSRKNRNVALTSILEAKDNQADKPLGVIPPMFRRKTDVEKKNILENTIQQPKQFKPSASAGEYYNKYVQNNEYRRSTPSTDVEESECSYPNTPSSKSSGSSSVNYQDVSGNQPKAFVPSSTANEYYMKFVKRNKIREQAREDIWARAEREMKLIDEKRKLDETLSPKDPKQTGLCTVSLVEHRHMMAVDCIVCEMVTKHGYKFDELSSF